MSSAAVDLTDLLVHANEDGTTARVLRWCKRAGERIEKDEPLLELETDKVTVEVPAPMSGVLAEILVGADAEVRPGQVLGRLCRDGAAAVVDPRATSIAEGDGARAGGAGRPGGAVGPGGPGGLARSAAGAGAGGAASRLSPAVRQRLQAAGLDAAQIAGSGAEGRITVADVERHLATRAGGAVDGSVRGAPRHLAHTPIRRRVAEHMARSLREAPHVTTVFEADLSRIEAHRRAHLAAFEDRGVRLTLTAYFVLATARTLRAHPSLNATYHDEGLELHPQINIGIGTALGEGGLVVPVIARADTLDLEATARQLQQRVEAARAGTLEPEDVRGGTFTLSNHGVSGSLLAAPIIIHQPQVAILGIGKRERRVRVLESAGGEVLAVRSMCYLTLSLDHRALDAYQANAFMSDLVRTLETWPDAN